MDTLRNLPIILRYEDDGSIVATCPLLANCQCKVSSRAQALRTMQQLIKHALADGAPADWPSARKYEVVHLAVAPPVDSVNRFSKRVQRTKTDSTLLHLV